MPTQNGMVYHEVRKPQGARQHYLVYNKRVAGKWIKESKFLGSGKISAKKIKQEKEQFELELKLKKGYQYLTIEQVKEIEDLKQRYWNKIKTLKKEEFEKFENSFFTELTYNSNAIEGNSLSLQETSLVVNENIVPEGKTLREVYESKNHMEAISFMKKYNGNITEQFILKLHHIILKGISERFAGQYRATSVRIFGSDVKFPDSQKVPQLVKNLIYWYNKNKKDMHSFELAAIFSMKLVTIHPFIDGNGRVSRLVMNFILQKNKYPWINIYVKKRAEYLASVRKANEEEYKPIIEFLIKNLTENLKAFKIMFSYL